MSSTLEDFSTLTQRKRDISTWKELDTNRLNVKNKKRYLKRKAAIEAYFITDHSLDEIILQHHLSCEELLRLVRSCLMRHQDGHEWGFRALLPGANVIDHPLPASVEEEPGIDPTPALSESNDLPVQVSQARTVQPASNALEETSEAEQPGMTHTHSSSLAAGERESLSANTDFADEQEDTAKRQAIKTQLATINNKIPETPALAFIADDEELAEETQAVPGMDGQEMHVEEPPDWASSIVEESPILEDSAWEAALANIDWDSAIVEESPVLTPDAKEVIDKEPPAHVEAVQGETQIGREIAIREEMGVVRTSMLILPTHARKRATAPVKKIAQQRRLVRKRWLRDLKAQREHKHFRALLSLALFAVLLITLAIPAGAGIAAYSAYSNIRDIATDGVNHLLNAKNAIPLSKSDPMTALNADKLQYAQGEFKSAENDFIQLQSLVNRPDVQAAVVQFAPEYSDKLGMAKHLVSVALDISRMGSEMSGIALLGTNIFHGSPLASSSTSPLITVTDISNIEGSLVHALYYLNDIDSHMSQVSLSALPISQKQQSELTSALALLPKARDLITQVQGQVSLIAWLLGVGQPRHFLVQTMDRAELRPSGGFTGQYGILEISNGRMSPFSLHDVAQLDYNGNGMELGRSAPLEYRNWMNFGNWGLRDSNLSGDYPTSARLSMQVFQEEGGGPVDGDISFTPTFIAHILNVTGPIRVPEYNEVVTASNLEERLHYYQQDFGAIALQRQKTGITNTSARKAFTTLVGKLLLDRVRHLPIKDLLNVVKGAIKDIQSRDLEIYFTNPAAEQWLIDHGYSGGIDTFKSQDGLMVVQANISISKASQYVHTTLHDDVTLDEQGGATHNLTISLNYQQTGPVYGYDTYADYIRVYAPENAQFISGDGFDTGQSLCVQKLHTCNMFNQQFSGVRYCPAGNYLALGDRNFHMPWKVDSLGPPTSYTSDLPGHAMWGGLTVTPKNCISYISLSWYVPNVVKKDASQPPYQLLIQKQGGYIPSVELTIDTSQLPIQGVTPFAFTGDLVADKLFSLALPKK